MVVLVVSFGVIWILAMFSGVVKTIRRKQDVRRGRAASKASLNVGSSFGESGKPLTLTSPPDRLEGHHEAASKDVASTQPGAQAGVDSEPAGFEPARFDASADNFDHPGDSLFGTPLAAGDGRHSLFSDSEPRATSGLTRNSHGHWQGVISQGRYGEAKASPATSAHVENTWFVNPLRVAALPVRQALPAVQARAAALQYAMGSLSSGGGRVRSKIGRAIPTVPVRNSAASSRRGDAIDDTGTSGSASHGGSS